jgi:hypothetical protein
MDAQLCKNPCSCAIRSKCDRCQLWTLGDPAVISVGAIRPAAAGRPYMPAFAAIYSDADIAAVANYVTGALDRLHRAPHPSKWQCCDCNTNHGPNSVTDP